MRRETRTGIPCNSPPNRASLSSACAISSRSASASSAGWVRPTRVGGVCSVSPRANPMITRIAAVRPAPRRDITKATIAASTSSPAARYPSCTRNIRPLMLTIVRRLLVRSRASTLRSPIARRRVRSAEASAGAVRGAGVASRPCTGAGAAGSSNPNANCAASCAIFAARPTRCISVESTGRPVARRFARLLPMPMGQPAPRAPWSRSRSATTPSRPAPDRSGYWPY